MISLRSIVAGACLGLAFVCVSYPDSKIATAAFTICMYTAMEMTP